MKQEQIEYFKKIFNKTTAEIKHNYSYKNLYYHLQTLDYFNKQPSDKLQTILSLDENEITPSILNEFLKTIDKKLIINNPTIQNLLTKKVSNTYNTAYLKIIKNYIKENHNNLFKEQMILLSQISLTEKDQAFVRNFITSILNDPLYGSKDIKYIDSGLFKDSFKIGDYVLQVGIGPIIQKYPKSTKIISPLLFYLIDNFQISITPYLVKTSKKEVQQCWNEAKEEGILLLDGKENNFGKHSKDFIHPFKDISSLGKEFLGIDKFYIRDAKKNETQYLDIDFYINENDKSEENEELRETCLEDYKHLYKEYKKERNKNNGLKKL